MMNWYKRAQGNTGISFIGAYNIGNADFVVFDIRGDRWAYKLSFPDWVKKIKQMVKFSPGKALAWAKERKSEAYKVTANFPMPGSIIKEEGEKNEKSV